MLNGDSGESEEDDQGQRLQGSQETAKRALCRSGSAPADSSSSILETAAFPPRQPLRSRIFKLIYLAAIAVATMGWLWMIVEGFAWAVT